MRAMVEKKTLLCFYPLIRSLWSCKIVFADRAERSANEILREEQDEEYRESLRADREKVL